MFQDKTQLAPSALFDGFEQNDPAQEPVDSFRSELIIAYERALENGISPITALSAVLDWASQEIKRYTAS
jgi:hypothetical protein